MIIPTSSNKAEDPSLPPPPYQESVPSPQPTPGGHPATSLYAPPVSPGSGLAYENERGDTPRLSSPDGRSPGFGFPEPNISTGRNYSEPPPVPPKDAEKEALNDGPAQNAFGAFSSMVWGTSTTASTSRSPISQDPLNPPPSAFTRPTPKNYAYLPFKPMTMLGISSNLTDGFLMIPPPINPEDERQANSQHPFVSHDVTEVDWIGFLAGLRTVSSSPGQAQKSFLAKIFISDMNERDQRKRAIHFVDSWNHYFFHPRQLTVVLARGRKIFNGASGNRIRRRHSVGSERGRDADPSHIGSHRHRSHSTDSSSSSSSSSSSDSSIHSATSEPREMPVPHAHTHYPHEKGFGGPVHGMGRGRGRGSMGFGGPFGGHPGMHGGPGGSGWVHPGLGAGPGRGGHHSYDAQKVAWKAQKHAWKVERRAVKREYRQNKRAMKHERRQRKREARVVRHHGGKHVHKGDQPWKLIITFHGARGDSAQS